MFLFGPYFFEQIFWRRFEPIWADFLARFEPICSRFFDPVSSQFVSFFDPIFELTVARNLENRVNMSIFGSLTLSRSKKRYKFYGRTNIEQKFVSSISSLSRGKHSSFLTFFDLYFAFIPLCIWTTNKHFVKLHERLPTYYRTKGLIKWAIKVVHNVFENIFFV